MKKQVIVIGAGGHGRVVADIIRANNDELLGFLDDNKCDETLGKVQDYEKYKDKYFVIGIGNTKIREKISKLPCNWYTAIHPSAIISPSAKIGEGTVVMANAVINADSIVGKQCIINTAAVVEHDNVLEDYVHISVGAKLGGTVRVKKNSWIGIGATVKNNITVGSDCMIGAGAVVVKDILKSGTYIGIPAKFVEKED